MFLFPALEAYTSTQKPLYYYWYALCFDFLLVHPQTYILRIWSKTSYSGVRYFFTIWLHKYLW